MLKAVFIDYTGTMIEEGGPDAMQMLRRCYKNSDIDSMESMLAYWWKLIKYFEAASSGDSFLTQDEIVDRTLEVCEKEIHLKENFEEIHELCRRFWMYAPAFPDTAEFFEKCSLPIYIITNNGLPYVQESMRDKGLNPAGIICGEMVRAYKPHRELFELALQVSGCARDEVVHIGDSPESDVKGALSAGILPVLLDRKGIKHCQGVTTVRTLTEALLLIERQELKPAFDLSRLTTGKQLVWINPEAGRTETEEEQAQAVKLTMADVDDAEARLQRFAPFIKRCFPETDAADGMIESALVPVPKMQGRINEKYGAKLSGRLYLKLDSHLPIAGSIKARGGIYEVLKHTEDLALEHGLITLEDSYEVLADDQNRKFFSRYTIQVGSTGNLGLSIGIMSAAVGYQVIVHMSADAREWKKELLRSHGVTVIEYESDYSGAVKSGRKLSEQDPYSYFVDDENSENLFLGYAVAAKRLKTQLAAQEIIVDGEHPLFVYIPCGVGGAPGGVAFGLKRVFGDSVHCFFVEPVEAPCMLAGMASGLHNDISVRDIGLSGITHADGLAVGRPSGFVGKMMEPLLGGIFTVSDANLYEYLRDLLDTEEVFLEPSACAAFAGPVMLNRYEETKEYFRLHCLEDKMARAVHIAWATGGNLVPEPVRQEYRNTFL